MARPDLERMNLEGLIELVLRLHWPEKNVADIIEAAVEGAQGTSGRATPERCKTQA